MHDAPMSEDRPDLATIHLDRGPSYEARTLTREKCHDCCELLRIARTPQRNAASARLEYLFNRPLLALRPHSRQLGGAIRIEVARKNRVDEHVVLRALHRQGFGEA